MDEDVDGEITRRKEPKKLKIKIFLFTRVMTCDVLPVAMFLLPTLSSIFLSQVSKKMTNEHIDAIFAKFDDNGDNKMSKKEFRNLMALSKKNTRGALDQGPSTNLARSQGIDRNSLPEQAAGQTAVEAKDE